MLELVWIMSMDISALVRLDMKVYDVKKVRDQIIVFKKYYVCLMVLS